jgi:mRNA interferase HigB
MTFMHVITRKRLNEFAEKFPDTKSALAGWYATALHYNRKKIYVRAVLTHAEYDEGRWKE